MNDIFWYPLIVVVGGLIHWTMYKYVRPYDEDLLTRLDNASLSGSGGDSYRPHIGMAIAIFGLIIFLIFNWTLLTRWISR